MRTYISFIHQSMAFLPIPGFPNPHSLSSGLAIRIVISASYYH